MQSNDDRPGEDEEDDLETTQEELEDQDEVGDDELQSMLQDDDDSAGAMTDTANTDWSAPQFTQTMHEAKPDSVLQHMTVQCWQRLRLSAEKSAFHVGSCDVLLHVLPSSS